MNQQLHKPNDSRVTRARVAIFAVCFALVGNLAVAQDQSAPAIIQFYEAKWGTIQDRMADIFVAGYGRMWVPPPQRADTGGFSVGYDVFDRYDLGSPRSETLYGTENGLKSLVDTAHLAGVRVHTDFIINHNGFSDDRTFDGQGTPGTGDDVTFEEGGGYPGFVLSAPGFPNGDFHPEISVDDDVLRGRLAGLIDFDQSVELEYIRQPVAAGNPQNIPAGTSPIFGRPPANVPTTANHRFYPDQALNAGTFFDPRTGQNVTLYDYNLADPLAGDAIVEDSVDIIMRNARWMIQEIGVDGFRLDAVRHFDPAILNEFDQAVFRAKKEPLLDGSQDHVYTFSETGADSSLDFLQSFIRKDINDGSGNLGGNRDALDFNLFFAIRGNLSENGLANDWRNIKNASIDVRDEGFANNGSQGVSFARSHDDGPAHLDNVAHAYLLMRPGESIVYLNAKQFGEGRPFPEGGRGDALGGVYGDAVTTLVNLRNTHGRGNYMDRTPGADEKELLFYERENSALVLLNNRGDSGFDQRTIQTGFAPGTRLVELTGNADSSAIDPNDDLANVVIVGANGLVTVRSPRNKSTDVTTDPQNPVEIDHRSGYLIYGVAGPQGRMLFTNTAGQEITSELAGSTPTLGQGGPGGPSDDFFNGNTRLADITVITDSQFKLRLETDAVSYDDGTGTFRDHHADGDFAQFSINGGIDANGNGVVDSVTPNTTSYGFENFVDANSPGFFEASGEGLYEQTIDATDLVEGRNYITGRVYRHRNPGSTGASNGGTGLGGAGDGGPAVFTDFREVVYVDLVPPETEFVSFDPFVTDPGNPDNRDLVVRSTDNTADRVHVFLDLPAEMSDADILQMALNGNDEAGFYDSGEFARGLFGVTSGNHVATVVAIEPTGNNTITRYVGLETDTNIGRGIGDLDSDNILEAADVASLEQLIASDNTQFNAAADATADGLIDTRDLIAAADAYAVAGAAARFEYNFALLRRADLDADGTADLADLELLYDNLGSADGLFDLNVDGTTDGQDAELFITGLMRSVAGDFNLDGVVDASDYTVWRDNEALGTPSLLADGDFDGDVDADDYNAWLASFGFVRGAFGASAAATSIPEPAAVLSLSLTLVLVATRRRITV